MLDTKEVLLEKCYELALNLRKNCRFHFYPEDIEDKFKYYYRCSMNYQRFGFEDMAQFLSSSSQFIKYGGNEEDPRMTIVLTETDHDFVWKHKLPVDPDVAPAVVNLEPVEATSFIALRVKKEVQDVPEMPAAPLLLKVKREVPEEPELIPPASPSLCEDGDYDEEEDPYEEAVPSASQEVEVQTSTNSANADDEEDDDEMHDTYAEYVSELQKASESKNEDEQEGADYSAEDYHSSTQADPSMSTSDPGESGATCSVSDNVPKNVPAGPKRFPGNFVSGITEATGPNNFIDRTIQCLEELKKEGCILTINSLNTVFNKRYGSAFVPMFRSIYPKLTISDIAFISDDRITAVSHQRFLWIFTLNNVEEEEEAPRNVERHRERTEKSSPRSISPYKKNAAVVDHNSPHAHMLVERILHCLRKGREMSIQSLYDVYTKRYSTELPQDFKNLMKTNGKWIPVLSKTAEGKIKMTLKGDKWFFKIDKTMKIREQLSGPQWSQTGWIEGSSKESGSVSKPSPLMSLSTNVASPSVSPVSFTPFSLRGSSVVVPSTSDSFSAKVASLLSKSSKKAGTSQPSSDNSPGSSSTSSREDIPIDPSPAPVVPVENRSLSSSPNLQEEILYRLISCLENSGNYKLDERDMEMAYLQQHYREFSRDCKMAYGSTSMRAISDAIYDSIDLEYIGERWIYRLRSHMVRKIQKKRRDPSEEWSPKRSRR